MENIVKSLLTGNLEIVMSNCVVRQCTADSAIVYEGPGILTQKQDRALLIRAFAAPIGDEEILDRTFGENLTPGRLVPDNHYFNFEGTDLSGTRWKANRVSIRTYFGTTAYVRAQPKILESIEECSTPQAVCVVRAFLSEKIELPWHSQSGNAGAGRFDDQFAKKSAHIEWRVVKSEDGTWLTFKCGGAKIEAMFEHFLRGLSILTGMSLRPIYLTIYDGNQVVTRIVNRLHKPDSDRLLVPIKTERGFVEDAHLFLEAFMKKFACESESATDVCSLIYRYWLRILRAREGHIENNSLVLSVAIEGLIQKTLRSEQDQDSEFVVEAKDAVPKLKKAGLCKRALCCVLSSLGNAKRPRTQDTLRRLVTEGTLNEAHVNAWKELRHAAAHGSMLEDDDEALQAHFDRSHICLDLYYKLVFHLIAYTGKHTDYASVGWPTRDIRSKNSCANG